MSTPGRYRNAALPLHYDAITDRTGGTVLTCTDCGALVLDQNTHDTWHTIAAATHLRDGDVLILTGDFSTDLEGRQHLNDLLARLDIAHRTLVVGDGLTAQVLPRETLEPGVHRAHCVTCSADFAATTEQAVIDIARDHCDRANDTDGPRHLWTSGTRPAAAP